MTQAAGPANAQQWLTIMISKRHRRLWALAYI